MTRATVAATLETRACEEPALLVPAGCAAARRQLLEAPRVGSDRGSHPTITAAAASRIPADLPRSGDPEPYLPPEERIPCPFLFERLNIDSRGKVMVCGFDIEAKTDMGNVHEKSIEEIWHGEGFARYRRLHLERRGDELELCRNCPDWKYRSWTHNYWKLVRKAGEKRDGRRETLNFMDQEGAVAEDD